MQYPDDFANYGFLSSQADDIKMSNREEFSALFEQAREQVRIALAEFFSTSGSAPEGVVVGLGMWARAVEAAQATLLLADRGMPGSAMATARTAWECLFVACALWKTPSLLGRLRKAHDFERLQQVRLILKTARDILPIETITAYQQLLDEADSTDPKEPKTKEQRAAEKREMKWSAWEAAEAAGLVKEHELHARGLALGGGHATVRSLDRHFPELEGGVGIDVNPSDEGLRLLLSSICSCLRLGNERLQEHASIFGKEPNPK